MPVVVRLPAALRDHAGGAPEFTTAGDRSLGEILDALAAAHPGVGWRIRDERGRLRRHVHVYVDGTDAAELGEDPTLGEDAVVHVLPAVSGG